MALVPLGYNARSLLVRRSATLLTVLGIAATVAVLAGVLALRHGFEALFAESGRDDIIVFLRPGAGSEGESVISRERANILKKSFAEIATDEMDRPLASVETYLAVRRRKIGGGETNVPIRGVEPMTFELFGDDLRIAKGRLFQPGSDEVVVGARLPGRIRNTRVGDVLVLNTTPFRVVGVLEHDGPFSSEIWGDVERISTALERPSYSRVIARLRSGVRLEEFAERLAKDQQAPAKVLTEREYLMSQTRALSYTLGILGTFLAVIMGTAAVFTATNTMLAAIAARTHEIGILQSLGFRRRAIFFSFLFESLLLGLLGGAVGSLLALPLNGIETGTTNFQTFTEVAFAFRVTPSVLATAITFSLILGLVGGAWPAWRAARMTPVQAMRGE